MKSDMKETVRSGLLSETLLLLPPPPPPLPPLPLHPTSLHLKIIEDIQVIYIVLKQVGYT